MIPRATYRLQFHAGFTFADAEALVPYLDRLGVSHVYASPITTARAGSTHGYDVVDPTAINPELGGEDGFRRLVAALRARGMGAIVDIVPNHMGVAGGGNVWWNDVLAHGPGSRFARFFDIDWRGRLVLPVLGGPLGAVLAAGDLRLERGEAPALVAYGEHRFPLRPEDADADPGDHDPDSPGGLERLRALADRQHYRLAAWRVADDALNWRRFFTVNDLAGLRIEDPEVFEATHALVFRLYTEGLIDGVRVDHVDGLTDPAGYCRTLRARLDALPRPAGAPPGPAYLVIEKILAADEPLARDWGVDGTSGYDFMREAAALLHAPEGAAPLAALWHEASGRPADFAAEELAARRDMLGWSFEGQLARCTEAFAALARSAPEGEGVTAGMLRRAIERLLWAFPAYRTYGTGTAAPAIDAPVRQAARARAVPLAPPGEAEVIDRLLAWLAGTGPGEPALAADAVRRFQQLSAPIAAKSVEDTAFYRYGRLLSGNDVGFDAGRLAGSIDQFHATMAARAARFPHALLATATHDHKRGEDVRARLAVLSELPDAWREFWQRWRGSAGEIDPGDAYMLFQTLLGAWPEELRADDGDGLAAFAARVVAWQEKALREAKLRSSWAAPDAAYEGAARALAERLLDPARSAAFLVDLAGLVDRLAMPAQANMLAQAALRCTVPGVPDFYQGAELADLSLVDPDNRRPVDFALRAAVLVGEREWPSADKLRLIARLLELRRRHPALFADGDYRPVRVTGARAGNVVAFLRTRGDARLLCVVAIRCAAALAGGARATPAADWWEDTALDLDEGRAVAALLADAPVHVAMLGA